MNVVSFSGGKDSTAMLLMMIEKNITIDRIIFIDTTKEFSQMYEHIDKVQQMIFPLKIEIVKIDFDYWFGDHIKTRGKLKGSKGYGFPGPLTRWCTRLKINAINKTIKSLNDVIHYIGIAYDEKERAKNNLSIKYPLIEWKITEKQSLDYCYSRGFNWGGLYEKFRRVSCWCCPFARINELRVLYNDFPCLWQDLKDMEKKSYRKFRADFSVEELSKRFENENNQIDIFKCQGGGCLDT